jgi:hypothetical protein
VARFSALHESGCGTNRTNQAGLMMSVDWGKAEVAFRGRQDRFDPHRTLHPKVRLDPFFLTDKTGLRALKGKTHERVHLTGDAVRP